jgi:hydrogenase expression/formation protein HypE
MAGTALGLVAPACPAPLTAGERVQLGHGSGGRMSAVLLAEHFLPQLGNPVLLALGDGAVVPAGSGELVISTDTFVVSPLEFPGGNIGSLAVHGTLNDVAMMGGRPRYLTAGFVLEEGLPFTLLDRVVAAMAACAAAAGVSLITGDTKVVERGKADGMFINTTGIGELEAGFHPAPARARPGDVIIVSAPLGRHGMAILSAREEIALESGLESDTAALSPLVERLRASGGHAVHVLRDPTRGGLASALNEIAVASGTGMEIEAGLVPVPPVVAAACEILGLDPLYVASEGVLVAVVEEDRAAAALAALRAEPLGREAVAIGRVVAAHPGLVVLRTVIGGSRVLDLLPGDQLPRIC